MTATNSVTESSMVEFENHIIARDMEPDDVCRRIKEIMNSNLDTVERGQGFSFEIPKRSKKYMEYNNTIGMPLLRAGNNTTRSFNNERTMHDATMTVWTMNVIYQIIPRQVTITDLELYHMAELLYGNEHEVNRILNDIGCLIGCKWRSLNVLPTQKGLVIGDISMRMKSGRVVKCSEVAQIPNDPRKISEIMVNKNAAEIKFILIVDKDSTFQHLQLMKFHTLEHCIIVTACGMPDFSTCEFVQMLKSKMKVPIYVLTDLDPSGVEMFMVYARGSVETAQENINLAIPDAHWLGISTLDCEDFGLMLNSPNSEALTRREIRKLSNMLTDGYLQLPDELKKRIRHVIEGKRKMFYEDLNIYGSEFAAKTFLPWLIDRLRKSGRPPYETEV